MKLILALLSVTLVLADNSKRDGAAPKDPVVGHWNVTEGSKIETLCLKLDGGIRLDVIYDTDNGTKATTSIVSDDHTDVDKGHSACLNSSTDRNETLALDFGSGRKLRLLFTRDTVITGDKNENKWQLYKYEFDFVYNSADFPDSKKRVPIRWKMTTTTTQLHRPAASRTDVRIWIQSRSTID